jgi:putative toxin-antitoxin system antitoxin component (TIGR02293 family)
MREKITMPALLAEAKRNEKAGAQTGFRCAMCHLRIYCWANGNVGRSPMSATAKAYGPRPDFSVGAERLEHLRTLGFSSDELYRIVAPRRTLARRREHGEPLSAGESDRVLRLERIAEQAERVFGSREKAHRWLRSEIIALDGARPIDLLETETGAHIVDQELIKIDYGMLA